MGFQTYETMRGHHEFVGEGPPGRQPFAFRGAWGPDRLRDWLNPASDRFLWQELRGEVLAGGLCDWTPMQGTLAMQYFGLRRIRYEFDFEVAGEGYRWLGDKHDIRLWNLPFSHTTCSGALTHRASGRLVSTGVVFFQMRDLPGLLRLRRSQG